MSQSQLPKAEMVFGGGNVGVITKSPGLLYLVPKPADRDLPRDRDFTEEEVEQYITDHLNTAVVLKFPTDSQAKVVAFGIINPEFGDSMEDLAKKLPVLEEMYGEAVDLLDGISEELSTIEFASEQLVKDSTGVLTRKELHIDEIGSIITDINTFIEKNNTAFVGGYVDAEEVTEPDSVQD